MQGREEIRAMVQVKQHVDPAHITAGAHRPSITSNAAVISALPFPFLLHKSLPRVFLCSLQTAMMCGWEKECTPGPGGNATVQMLEKSKENLRTRMGAFGLFEKFESTIKVVGERLPAYFEG